MFHAKVQQVNIVTSSEDENHEIDENHDKLLAEITAMGNEKKKRKIPVRTEPSPNVSDFGISAGSGKGQKIVFQDLVASIKKSKKLKNIKDQLNTVKVDQSVVEPPIPKPQLERFQRTVLYQDTSKDISKWTDTIRQNRKAEHLSFPLNRYRPTKSSLSTDSVQFKVSTPLEQEIETILNKSKKNIESRNKELTEAEEEALKTMDLEEAKERLAELRKMRALQSHYEQKCKRQKKIKSKKYHRIKKKAEKKKLTKMSMEELMKQDPETIKDDLEKEERARALERVSLRHRNTSKWARYLAAKGRNNPETRKALTEQLKKSRELTEKKEFDLNTAKEDENDRDSPDENNVDLTKIINPNQYNPWLASTNSSKQESSHKDVNTTVQSKQPALEPRAIESDSDYSSVTDDNDDIDITKTNPDQNKLDAKNELDEFAIDDDVDNNSIDQQDAQPNITSAKETNSKKSKKSFHITEEASINPNKFLILEDRSKNALNFTYDGNDSEDSDDSIVNNQLNVEQAFEDDDVIEEFLKEKELSKEASKPKETDLRLPGWGAWSGAGIKKRKKKTKPVPPPPRRQDDHLKNVIINESVDERFTKHQVTQLPHSCRNYRAWNNTMNKPIGRHWNSQSTVEKLTRPRISTLMGTIIDPIKPPKTINKNKKAKDSSSSTSLKIY
ncbi:uncharacterized protein TRIADDRAFT_59989 [Trichoplax adhaerens]|uniref:Uncharacterized protein n=1 Tax=Trichoplax adhaerens TaxID=10228 RepID=B3S702_TRIAD|nr:hypothetical protein TRIADDRAFT_59989 [Trichoplax adhaerens]EDV21483.1 hypothetical protein TRIADDRAFT_59989 [Trichoplax adhaerens]|eukprot:XP_002116083.1 hypothetical protein TRIADDRAFT_59989 [Trichoplax adhaerens]